MDEQGSVEICIKRVESEHDVVWGHRLTRPSIVDIIKKKRDGMELDEDEIGWFVKASCRRLITDAQIGAMLMAICIRGMTDRETFLLAEAMIQSGNRLQYPAEWQGRVVGKHSTGGIGDKVTLVLVPALAACGLKVPKMSGRGLGFTGGTLDKLESIPGCQVYTTKERIVELVEKNGCCIVGQTNDLTPADKLLYAIRDTTATTESLPLIAASVMSKKAAENLNALCLEVTFGNAALTKTKQEARKLAEIMMEIGRNLGIRTSAMLVSMNNVLGQTVGNTLEVIEAVQCLRNEGTQSVIHVVCVIGGYLLWQTGKVDSADAGYDMIMSRLSDGSAAKKFQSMIEAQGVSRDVADTLVNGYVQSIDALICGRAVHSLGSGRINPEDKIDYTAGIQLIINVGAHVNQGDVWAHVHHNVTALSDSLLSQLRSALVITDQPVLPDKHIDDIIC